MADLSQNRLTRTGYIPAKQFDQPNSSNNNHEDLALNFEQDVILLNKGFDDIEKFVARLQQVGVIQRENFPRQISPHFPSQMEFHEILQQFKQSFNLLAKLKNHIHDPNAPELLHFLFTAFTLILDACNWGIGQNVAQKVQNPPITQEAKNLLHSNLTGLEMAVWLSLGDAWTVPVPASSGSPVHTTVAVVHEETVEHGIESSAGQQSYLASLKLKRAKCVQTIYGRGGEKQQELSVSKGEFLEVLNDSKNWWECRNIHNRIGYVPHTILNIINDDVDPRQASRPNVAVKPPVAAKPVQLITNVKAADVTPQPPVDIPNDHQADILAKIDDWFKDINESDEEPISLPDLDHSIITDVQLSNAYNADVDNEDRPEPFFETKTEIEERQPLSVPTVGDDLNHQNQNAANEPVINEFSSIEDIKEFLMRKGFSHRTINVLGGQSGATLFALSKSKLQQFCGLEEGKRLYGHLALHKSVRCKAIRKS